MKPKFEIGDRVIMSNAPTKRGSQFLEKFTFYTISEYKKARDYKHTDVYVYKVRGLDNYWFADQNFILYSRDENKWVPFEKCNNIEVGDYVKLNYHMYCSGISEKIDEIFNIHEYRIISEIGPTYVLVENEHYPIADGFLLYKKPDVSQNKSNKADIFDVDLGESEGNKPLVVYTKKNNFCESPQTNDSEDLLKQDVNKNKTEIDKSEDIFILHIKNPFKPNNKPIKFGVSPFSGIISYVDPQEHDSKASPEDEQIFNAMQITLDAAKYSAFPFGSPDYMINIKFGGSYNNK